MKVCGDSWQCVWGVFTSFGTFAKTHAVTVTHPHKCGSLPARPPAESSPLEPTGTPTQRRRPTTPRRPARRGVGGKPLRRFAARAGRVEWRSYRSELERPGHGEIRPDPINRERMRDRHRRGRWPRGRAREAHRTDTKHLKSKVYKSQFAILYRVIKY